MTHVAQVWRAQRTFHVIVCVIFMRSCCVFDSPRLSLPLLAVYLLSNRLVHLPSLPHLHLSDHPVHPSFFFHDVEDKYPVHSR